MSETKKEIVIRDGKRYYTEDGVPVHRGVVEIDGDLYYAGKEGKLVVDSCHIVHRSMTNDLLDHGTYRFDESGKVDKDSLIAPKQHKKKHKHHSKRKSKTKWFIIGAAAVLAAALAVVLIVELTPKPQTYESTSSGTDAGSVYLYDQSQPVYLCNNYIKSVYEGKTVFDNYNDAVNDAYRPLTLEYQLNSDQEAYLRFEGQEYPLTSGRHSVVIDNLFTGRSYDYQLVCGDQVSEGTITTASTNRFVTIGDLIRVRDIGGYTTRSGKRIKQGMIIRGTEIDGLVKPEYYLTDPSDAAEFGFVYDFDLREPSVSFSTYTSPLGDSVRHKFYDAPSYAAMLSDKYREITYDIFSDLSKPENYPMYLHCTYGMDRTGTVVYLLQALLGVEEDQLLYEYGLSGSSCTPEKMAALTDYLNELPGADLSEKTEYFLKNKVGISDEQIRSIRNILLEQ